MIPVILAAGNSAAILNQTPGNSGTWKDAKFLPAAPGVEGEWLVVFDNEGALRQTRVPKERRIIFVTEPPEARDYYPHYINQFGIVVSPMPVKGFRGIWLQQHGALNWHIKGSYDELLNAPVRDKPLELSIVCSNAGKFSGHRRRFAFASKLKDILQDRLHWYGRGVRGIENKEEAIAPYRYSIAIENNSLDHFFTEKVSDIYLGGAFPFYAGAANLHRYFDERSFACLDLDDPEGSARTIIETIESQAFERCGSLLQEQRLKILNEYNLFSEAWKVIHKFRPVLQSIPLLAGPERIFSRTEGVRSWVLSRRKTVRRTVARIAVRRPEGKTSIWPAA